MNGKLGIHYHNGGVPISKPSCIPLYLPTAPGPKSARNCTSFNYLEAVRLAISCFSRVKFLLTISCTEVLSVPKNMKLLAVPLFELYDNVQRYGPQLSAIPHLLSRYNFEFVNEEGKVVAVTPGGGPFTTENLSVRVLAGEDTDMKQENGD
jgi:hypothetical protein